MVAPDSASTISAWVSSVAGSSGWTHGGLCEKTAIALRAETTERVHFWANSTKVRIGWMRKRP